MEEAIINATIKRARADENVNVCRAMLCDSLYFVPTTIYTGHGYSVDLRAKFNGLHFAAASNINGLIVYVLLGTAGLPVFVGGTSGIGKLFGPTGGFIFAWVIAYPILSMIKGSEPNFKRYALTNILTVVPITYAGGLISMLLLLDVNLWQALTMAVFPFIPGDIFKALAAAFIGVKLNKFLGER